MNLNLLITGLAVVAGMLMAAQAPTNALIARAAASPILAAFVSFVVGTLALGAISLASGSIRALPELKGLPSYAWVGGFYGAFFVAVAALAAPRIGTGSFFTAAVAGQLAAALLLDHFGWLGLDRIPASPVRVAGLGLVLVGAWLVRRG